MPNPTETTWPTLGAARRPGDRGFRGLPVITRPANLGFLYPPPRYENETYVPESVAEELAAALESVCAVGDRAAVSVARPALTHYRSATGGEG